MRRCVPGAPRLWGVGSIRPRFTLFTVVGPNAVDSKILGVIPVEKLSSGVKTLLLLRFMPDKVYNATNCGDNCAYWILKIAKMQDIAINLYHMMDFGNRRFTARIANTGEIIHTMDEFALVAAGVQKLR